MGLDMYLYGEKFFWTDWQNPENNRTEDGFKISTLRVKLGDWRKHPDLHGYIVQTFAEGVDKCQDIELTDEDITDIIDAVRTCRLPHTEGFFFGESQNNKEEIDETISILNTALEWVWMKEKGVSRSIIYRASW